MATPNTDDPIIPQGVTLREFDDTRAARKAIYDGTLEALKKRFPLENKSYRLELSNVRFTGPQDFTLAQQKQALLTDKNLHTPVSGRFRLIRKSDNAVVDEKDEVVMNVPYYTDRGTIINNGSEYTVANQLRLRPGVYTRIRRSGDVETQFNVKPGTGRGFRLRMEPSTGVITVNVGHANMPLYPLLKALGVSDRQMQKAWGADVAYANAQKANSGSGRSAVDKLYKAFAGYNAQAQDLVSKETYLRETLPKFELDPGVTVRTLGIEANGVTPEVLLRASEKMFGVNRGDERPDDRDNPGYANVYGIEDLYRERIEKDAGRLSRNIMMKISRAGSLKPVGRGAFSGWHDELLHGSGLAMPGDNSNPMSVEEQLLRVTRLGEGGIGSPDLLTDEARAVNPGNLNYIDAIAGPENGRIGADARLGVYARKGSDGRLYSLFINRQGKKEYIAADTASDHVIGFPGSDPKDTVVPAMKRGRVQMVPREEVDYFVPSTAGLFSSNINLNPMPTAIQGGRQFYAAKFWGQYLPAAHGEVPLVASLMPDGKTTWLEHYGRRLGTLKAGVDGVVTQVTDKGVTVKDQNGKKHFVETVTDFPFNGLTGLTYAPTVKAGDAVKADDIVAASNFVDPRTGSLAMGRNMRIAWLSAKGLSYEDSVVISEDAAKKLATNRLYGFESEPRDGGELGLSKFMSAFPKKFTRAQYETLDDNGVVKEGTVLNKGDPICVAVGPKLLTAEDATLGKLSKVLRGAFTDKSQVWDHDYPGTVVSSTVFRGRAKVNVKAAPPLHIGDKMCYDEETEVLTSHGWKHIKDVTLDDNVATLNPDTGVFDYLKPDVVHKYEHSGKMYRLSNSCLDILVTTNHRLLVQRRGHTRFEFMEAGDALGRRLSYKKDGVWRGTEVKSFTFPSYQIGHRWGLVTRPEVTVSMDTFLMLLGMYLSEGSCYSSTHGGGSNAGAGICISQKKPGGVASARKALDGAGVHYTYSGESFMLCGRHFYNYFRQFGHAPEKFIPEFVFGLSARQQRIVFDWLMWGDGHCRDGVPKTYTTSSRRLADDVQRLCLHIGIAARVCPKQPAGHYNGMIDGRKIFTKHDIYNVQIINSKLTPTVNHGHVKSQHVQVEGLVDYSGFVYCCTMPKWHAIYVRRNGHAYWCGNSPTSALKGTVGAIIPMDKMPRDAATNEPYDILMNPMGIPSRIAPGPVIESALGKLAKARGSQIRIPQDPPSEGWAAWAKEQLDAAGVSPTADVFDPETGKTIKGVGDGYVYWHAMHHIADKKLSAKGGAGGYTADLQPAKGGKEGAKRVSGLDGLALLSHGATEVLKDVQTIRGTRNESYWKAVRSGGPLPQPEVPFIYRKAMNLLRAGGINVVEGQKATDIMPMTDRDTERLSGGRVIYSGRMLDDDMKDIEGGLFDPHMTGGSGNQDRWAEIRLPEAIPNPVMEEPVRRVLGLTSKRLQAIISGSESLDGKTGGEALSDALGRIDVDREIARQKDLARKSRGSARDNAVKVIGYLSGCKKQGVTPKDWMITRVPVIPPMFRPVAKIGDTALISDINELYRDVIESADAFRSLHADVGDAGTTEERLNVYKAVKAAYGLGEPISPEGQAKGLKGAIRQVIGAGSPKFGTFQAKVLSKAVDGVGRAVIGPEPNYDMDQCGVPEDAAWKLYRDYVIRSLVRRGYPQERAQQLCDDRAPVAKDLLLEEMGRRPVILDRAPTWHKFNLMAFWPSLVKGSTLRMNPLVEKGFCADHDGDQMNFHVPASDKAVREAIDKMMPSKNLFSLTDLRKPRFVPNMEMTLGLAKLTAPASKAKPRVFVTAQDAVRAYRRGEIGANDPVSVLRA